MKIAILLVSLVANLGLAAWLWRQPASLTPAPPPAAVSVPVTSKAAPASATESAALSPQDWAPFNTASDTEFVAQLRAADFPPSVLAALVSQRVRERHAGAFKKFRAAADFPYWRRTLYEWEPLSPEERAARRTLNRQIADEVRELLGADADPASEYMRANRERMYGNLPVEKVDQLTAVIQDYGEVSRMLREKTAGILLPEDREQLAALEKEKRADLAKILTPEELREYDLRSSPSATSVRSRLRYFEPSEEEFRALATLQLDFDATFGNGTNLSAEQQQRRREATADLNAQIKTLLSPERFAEYEIKTDPAYTSLASMVSQYNPSADLIAAVSAQRDLAQRYNAIRNNRDLAPAARNAQLATLSAEANTRMEAALGPDAFKVFKGNGSTINSLLNWTPKP